MITPVILCGGSGTRLWPLSRRSHPKQFLALEGSRSLLQETLARFSGPGFAAPVVMTAEEFRFVAADQVGAVPGGQGARLVVEPEARDTAPAVLAAALLHEDRPKTLLLVTPSDHRITDPQALRDALGPAAEAARAGRLVTFGIPPDRPETGFGYLELAAPAQAGQAVALAGFREKPDAAVAAGFLASGRHLWNAGLVLARAGDLIEAFAIHAPGLIAPVRAALSGALEDMGFLRLSQLAWSRLPSISFDYAVLEKAGQLSAVPVDCGWSDLGSWDALVAPGEGVVTHGAVTAIDTHASYLRSEEPEMRLVTIGLRDVVAVATRDAVLVADRHRAQEVRAAVAAMKAEGAPQAETHPRSHRPWGWFETLCLGPRFQVKRIMVAPGSSLSLQSHRHRAEHWVVVAGTAEVTIGTEVRLVSENQSAYIPLGARHRLANPGKVPVYLIEVQTGAYLGEDDILRHEDVYNRA